MKVKSHISLILLIAVVLLSFSYGSNFWKIEKSESFIAEKNDIANSEIQFFYPEVLSISITDHVDRNFLDRQTLFDAAVNSLRYAWKKNKINAVFLEDNKNEKYSFEDYQRLMALRMEIIQANNLQYHPLDAYKVNYNDITQSVFVNTPKIDFGYGDLSNVCKSKYFALAGFVHYLVSPKNAQMRNYLSENEIVGWGNYHYYYCLLVDVERGEVIYREFKKVSSKLNEKRMTGYLFNSFYVFKKNLENS